MTWSVLRPVGEPLVAVGRNGVGETVIPPGYRPYYVQSGTAGLALALLVVKAGAGSGRRRVLLPAYGCPDLVAAVIFAGLDPELVDTAPDEPFMDVGRLAGRLGEDVLAVLGVHFLGLADRISTIIRLAGRQGTAVIEDSAQRVAGAGGPDTMADLVVASFGRGKPVGALGGGVLLVREGRFSEKELQVHIRGTARPAIPVKLARVAYNKLMNPVPYGALCRMPGIALGETVYRPLRGIQYLDMPRINQGLRQWSHAQSRGATRAQTAFSSLLKQYKAFTDLSSLAETSAQAPLLRFPLLCRSKAVRDSIYGKLSEEGLGASIMYGGALTDLRGVPRCAGDHLDSSRDFAARLLTLPVHSDIGEREIARISDVIERHSEL